MDKLHSNRSSGALNQYSASVAGPGMVVGRQAQMQQGELYLLARVSRPIFGTPLHSSPEVAALDCFAAELFCSKVIKLVQFFIY
jgi:hypothetical protein